MSVLKSTLHKIKPSACDGVSVPRVILRGSGKANLALAQSLVDSGMEFLIVGDESDPQILETVQVLQENHGLPALVVPEAPVITEPYAQALSSFATNMPLIPEPLKHNHKRPTPRVHRGRKKRCKRKK